MAWQPEPTGTKEKLLGVWCADEEVIAVGTRGTVVQRTQSGWRTDRSETTEDLYAIAGSRDGRVIVGGNLHVGGDSLVMHREAGRWIREPSGMQHILLSVCATTDGWAACGYNGAVIRGAPGAWHREDVVHYLHAFAVCSAERHVFVGGLSGAVIAFDGKAWRPESTPVDQHLRAMAATSPDHVIAVGLQGTILRFDGSDWTEMQSPTHEHLEGVWLGSRDYGYAAGYGGTLLEYDGRSWRPLVSGTDRNLHAVHGNAGVAVAVGEDGTACRFTPG